MLGVSSLIWRMLTMTSWTVEIKQYGMGDRFIELPKEATDGLGWQDGDEIEWIDNDDGSYTLMKKDKTETCLVMVECVQQYRTRYVVEVPTTNPEWALDTVTCQEAKEFSQQDLGETIVSHRIITEQQALDQFKVDTDYGKWTDEQIKRSSITYEEDYVK